MAITSNARPKPSTNRILLVEPEFPLASKSKNHKDFLPIGLLKIGAWFESRGIETRLVRGNVSESKLGFAPDEVWITSLFTYWSKYVVETAEHYRKYKNAPRIVIGGIYASLAPKDCQRDTKAHTVSVGVHQTAEKFYPAYHLLNSTDGILDYQVVHASRGCIRRCKFCGVHIIEPDGLHSESTVLPLIAKPQNGRRKICSIRIESDNEYVIEKKNLVFYDNNFLANKNIEKILDELAYLKKKGRIDWCESQCGFDGRIMEKNPILAKLLRKAGFRYPRIAWDWGLNQGSSIKQQIDLLVEAGYKEKDISVFMIYNWGIPFSEMEEKRVKCYEWGVQISDCRYRPLNAVSDEYNPRVKKQDSGYYVHTKKGWSDKLVRQFRKNVRRQNICIRHGFAFYSHQFETKKASIEERRMIKEAKTKAEKKRLMEILGYPDYWDPSTITTDIGDSHLASSKQTEVMDFIIT